MKRLLQLETPESNVQVLEIFLIYLQTGYVVIPDNFNDHSWMEMGTLADYFCLERLQTICEQQLCHKLSQTTFKSIFRFALQTRMNTLAERCAEMYIKASVDRENSYSEGGEIIVEKQEMLGQ